NVPQAYNLNPNLEQAPDNPHASHLNDRYRNASGPLLKARMMSAAEVHFILAEAALLGWNSGADATQAYNNGVSASLTAWELGDASGPYLAQELVTFDGSLERLIEQKWISSWTAAAEAWFDYRRTGFPQLTTGDFVKRPRIPLRLYYSNDEIDFNRSNAEAAIDRLETTEFSAPDGNNSAWSRMWLLQGVEGPW
ncbi:MAG: SusD/RagB family nutrient-binding outer membrane lipoprotein, partial [Saprospiraceae bacterium]|nr:SusD/RagB family nutrient-binding outer membrane lipoprotein [Saprospiraceae bacterium]